MTRENPDYFEAVIVMREPSSRTARRVDVFQFAFDSDGTIGRIRRRARCLLISMRRGLCPKTRGAGRSFSIRAAT